MYGGPAGGSTTGTVLSWFTPGYSVLGGDWDCLRRLAIYFCTIVEVHVPPTEFREGDDDGDDDDDEGDTLKSDRSGETVQPACVVCLS